MRIKDVMMVRIYLTEAEGHLDTLLKRLHDWSQVQGVTVFHGIAGFGPSGPMQPVFSARISEGLPIVVEFFDEPAKVEAVLETLSHIVKPGHVVCWPAHIIVEDK